MPTSGYPEGVSSGGFAPAPLDFASMHNGVAKFDHKQRLLSTSEIEYALGVLHDLFPLLEEFSSLADQDQVEAALAEHAEKSAGEPWRCAGLYSKGRTYQQYGLSQLEEYYRTNTSVISSTLKDELRLEGKDSRLYRPQDVSSYIEGCRLFLSQNEYLSETGKSPVFCRFQVPGQDVVRMFDSLRNFEGKNFAADGSQWDARFPLIVAAIIAQFRIDGGLDRERVERYYSQMYNGFTMVFNEYFNLAGQPSGHFNTSIDNSLGHIIVMSVHACRSGLTIEQFISQVKYYCCGDDLIWSTIVPIFFPHELERTYNSLGMFLTFQSYDSLPVDDLIFVGVKSAYTKFGEQTVRLFSLVSDRSFAALHCHKKVTEKRPIDKLAKFASLAILWFCDDERYSLAKEMFFQTLASLVSKNRLSRSDPRVKGLASVLNRRRLFRMYMGWESKKAVSFSAVLDFKPSGYDIGGLKRACRRRCELSLGEGIQCSVVLLPGGTGASKRCTHQTR